MCQRSAILVCFVPYSSVSVRRCAVALCGIAASESARMSCIDPSEYEFVDDFNKLVHEGSSALYLDTEAYLPRAIDSLAAGMSLLVASHTTVLLSLGHGLSIQPCRHGTTCSSSPTRCPSDTTASCPTPSHTL